jgi:hypothetical protein
MKTEAVKAGYYETEFGKYPKIQILTIKELFEDRKPAIPLVGASSPDPVEDATVLVPIKAKPCGWPRRRGQP